MISKLKRWIYSKMFFMDASVQPIKRESVICENTRDQDTRKRVAAAFEQQRIAMNARALRPHGAECADPLSCMDRSCFKLVPDKIVHTEIVESKRKS